jgi:3-phenylpropionate/cinnamic acid dioxygenase small subunit
LTGSPSIIDSALTKKEKSTWEIVQVERKILGDRVGQVRTLRGWAIKKKKQRVVIVSLCPLLFAGMTVTSSFHPCPEHSDPWGTA